MLQVFVNEIQVAIGLQRFVLQRFTVMTSGNQRPKISENYKNFQKMHNYEYHMWCKAAGQPIRDESFPHLPSKPISVVRKTAVFTFIAFISELKYNNNNNNNNILFQVRGLEHNSLTFP
jgi:hypothetical protein